MVGEGEGGMGKSGQTGLIVCDKIVTQGNLGSHNVLQSDYFHSCIVILEYWLSHIFFWWKLV